MATRLSLLSAGGKLQDVLQRQKEAARLFAAGHTNAEVAQTLGYHPAYMPVLKQQLQEKGVLPHYEAMRDEAVVKNVREGVEQGAKKGLDLLLKALTKGTQESEEIDPKTKVKIAQDFLDREGTAPRLTRQQSQGGHMHMHLTGDDIAELKALREGKVAEAPRPLRRPDENDNLIPADLLEVGAE